MLTSDEKAKLWEHVAVNRGNGLQVTAMTLYNEMDELEDQVRTLQQQNKQLIDVAIQGYKYHCSACNNFSRSYSNHCYSCGKEGYFSGSFSKDMLREWFTKSIQGGTSNGTS